MNASKVKGVVIKPGFLYDSSDKLKHIMAYIIKVWIKIHNPLHKLINSNWNNTHL